MPVMLVGMRSGGVLRLRVADQVKFVGDLAKTAGEATWPAGAAGPTPVWYREKAGVILDVMAIEYVVPEAALAKEGGDGQG